MRRVVGTCIALAISVTSLGCGFADPVEEARELIEQGRARDAIALLEDVVREERENLDAQFYYGQALTMAGEGGL